MLENEIQGPLTRGPDGNVNAGASPKYLPASTAWVEERSLHRKKKPVVSCQDPELGTGVLA